MISKPTAMPAVVAIYGMTGLITIFTSPAIRSAWAAQGRRPTRLIAVKSAILFAGVLVPVAPYLLVNGHWIASYIHMALVDHQVVAGLQGTFWQHATFYAKRSRHVLGMGFWMLAVVGAFSAGRFFVSRDRETFPVLRLLIVTCGAYIVTSVPKVKLDIFGSYIYGLLFAVLVVGLATLLRWLRSRHPRYIHRAATCVFLTMSLLGFQHIQSTFSMDFIETSRKTQADILPIIAEHITRLDPILDTSSCQIRILYPWPVAPHAFMFALLREGRSYQDLDAICEKADGLYYTSDASRVTTAIADARLVVALAPSTVQSARLNYPLNATIEDAERLLEDRSKFSKLRTIETAFGPVSIYSRRETTHLAILDGFAPVEGPHPTLGLPRKVRWLARAGGSLRITADVGATGRLVAHCAPGPEVQAVKIAAVDHAPSTVHLQIGFQDIELPLGLSEPASSAVVRFQPLNGKGEAFTDTNPQGLLCDALSFKPG